MNYVYFSEKPSCTDSLRNATIPTSRETNTQQVEEPLADQQRTLVGEPSCE